ncbi:ABC transporter ATP-binding protein [uncultured Desulfosarcina sp.]|uniref:ABC transporter ATP-binding protein n=1 Tax=uncultured Desulfosarcina sp. TaxID=218289 RepID=UPI0029C78562|nr:ABC transporter ATP-binding protein [uncultured Desulfosarcina sp.]
MLIDVKDIHAYYGKSHILHGVSMQLQKGELVCLLGRNGVGKTTTMKSIMGLVPAQSGSIVFNGQELTDRPPHEIARCGVGIVPETRRIFGSLTVHENLLIGIKKSLKTDDNVQSWTLERIYESFPLLKKRQHNKGKHLSGGEQQVLTVARTLMGNPELILVDEPTEGLAPLIVKDVLDMLSKVRESGVTVLMVEQNFNAAINVADRFYIMGKGHIVFEGNEKALLAAKDVRKTYLEV